MSDGIANSLWENLDLAYMEKGAACKEAHFHLVTALALRTAQDECPHRFRHSIQL
jgi:hypothetical protein